MELIINKTTYVLKPVNIERKETFIQLVLKNYNPDCENFYSFIDEVQQILEKEHNLKMTKERVKINFFKEHLNNVMFCLWQFIKDEDKKELKSINELNVEQDQIVKFIEYVSREIKKYCEYVGESKNNEKEDIYYIYSYLSNYYGWSFEVLKEMDSLELYKAIENSILITEEQSINTINSQALGSALGNGNKQAKNQLDRIQNRIKTKKFLKNNPKFEMKKELSREQIAEFMRASNG